jgi:hypothetical protein
MRRCAASWLDAPGLFSTGFDWAEEKSRISQLVSAEAALTASDTRGEVVAGL